jgi:hypothetical protein
MDFKSALDKAPIVGSDEYVEIASSDKLDDLEPFIHAMSARVLNETKQVVRREDLYLNTLFHEHETHIQDVLNHIKEKYFFDGLCTDLTVHDICNVFKQATRIEYNDEDNTTNLSDEDQNYD